MKRLFVILALLFITGFCFADAKELIITFMNKGNCVIYKENGIFWFKGEKRYLEEQICINKTNLIHVSEYADTIFILDTSGNTKEFPADKYTYSLDKDYNLVIESKQDEESD